MNNVEPQPRETVHTREPSPASDDPIVRSELVRLSTHLLRQSDPTRLLRTLTESISAIAGLDLCQIVWRPRTGDQAILSTLVSAPAGPVETSQPLSGDALAERAFRDQQRRCLGPGRALGDATRGRYGARIVVPAITATGTAGVAMIARTSPTPYSHADAERVEILASYYAVARQLFEATHASRRHATIVADAPNAILVIADDGTITLANRAAEGLFGYSSEDLLGLSVHQLIPADPRVQAGETGLRFLHTPDSRPMGSWRDVTALREDGSTVPVAIGLNPFDAGQRRGILASLVEISNRKQAELVQGRLLSDLEDALRARDLFLSIASHELKTPISTLQLNLEMIARGLSSEHELAEHARLESWIRSTLKHTHRLTELVNQLLDVSRIASGRLELKREPVDLGELVAEVVDRFRADLADRQLTISITANDGVIGHWDRSRLDQVATNLVCNAIKYGAGEPIEVGVHLHGKFAVLSVRDHGPGIAAEDQDRIFGRFERAVSDHPCGGFGLGLWLVSQFVSAHDGDIRVVSEPGHGATFEVSLPVQSPQPTSMSGSVRS